MEAKMAQGEQHHHHLMTPQSSGPTYPFLKAGLIIGGVIGFMSGMAQANTFTRLLPLLVVYSFIGAILFAAGFGIVAFVIDKIRHSRGKSLG